MNETRGDFQLEESTLVLIDASIYEARSGSAEGTLCQMVFEDGTRLKVKPFIHVSLENIDVIGQEDDGTIKLAAAASDPARWPEGRRWNVRLPGISRG